MLVAGVDENGLGPRLGPLVTTLTLLEVERYRPRALYELGNALGIRDSKKGSGFGKMAAAEGVVLALLERTRGRRPLDSDELLQMVSLVPPAEMRAHCPPASSPQCWSDPVSLPAFGGDGDRGREALQELEAAGVRLIEARSAVACAARLNAEVRRLGSKLSVDLMLFEKLLLHARSLARADLRAYCGMVGGIRKYPRYLSVIDPERVQTLGEVGGTCGYRVEELGELFFEVDADAHHLPVGLASMVGKYLREVMMERQNRFYLGLDPSLGRVSGYRDPATRRFVQLSAPLRQRLGIADECFER